MKVYLIRHGRTVYNEQKRYQGQADIPLSDPGRRELMPAPFSAETVYGSPLSRARESAAILFPHARQIAVEGFTEFAFGDFEGRSYLEMADDAAYRAWVDGGCEGRCPGGESLAEFRARTCDAFLRLLQDALARGDERLVIVAHSGTLRAILERFALPEQGYFAWNPPCGCGYALAFDGEKLRLFENIRFVKEGPAC